MKDLSEKKILLIGANGLIGEKVCDALLNLKCNLTLIDILDAKLLNKKIKGLNYYQIDINNSSQLEHFISSTGPYNGVVNLSYPRNNNYGKEALDVTLKDFNENVSLMLGSNFILLKTLALNYNKYKNPISIINVASVYGVVAPKFEIYNNLSITMPIEYAASKSAIIHLTKYFAKYIASPNFRVNCLSPGGIEDSHEKTFTNNYGRHTISGKMLSAEDLVGSVLFLLSNLSRSINGHNLVIDDGFCL